VLVYWATTPENRGVAPQSAGSIAETATGGALVVNTNVLNDPNAAQDSVSFARPPLQSQLVLFPLPLVTAFGGGSGGDGASYYTEFLTQSPGS